MRLYRSYCDIPLLIVALTAGLTGAGPVARAATVLWDGGAGTNMNWTADGAGGNWSGDAQPAAGDTAVFTHIAGGAAHGALTNVVPGSYTVHTLSYQLDTTTPTAFFHTTEIAAGQTLLVTNGLNVSPAGIPAQGYTEYIIDVVVLGPAATLRVGNPGTYTANMTIGHTSVANSSHSSGKLDLSGLQYFEANLNTLRLGRGVDFNTVGVAELKLAPTSVISATTIETGRGTGQASILLGQDNVIRADTFYLSNRSHPGDRFSRN